jgi:FHA domain-containing protein
MKITVVSLSGKPVSQKLSADFDQSGGSIGRAKTNQLVLEDPDRTVSRVHAQILSRNGSFVIIDRGSNPLSCNGVALGAGNEVVLSENDKLQIGSFELSVSNLSAAQGAGNNLLGDFVSPINMGSTQGSISADDPFADLLAGLAPAPSSMPSSMPPAASNAVADSLFPDPMEYASPKAHGSKADAFDDLLNFGDASPSPALPNQSNTFAGLPTAASSSIDELFGLGSTSTSLDPFASSPLAQPLLQPNTSSSADPLLALQSDAKAVSGSRSDHTPVLQQAYSLPKAVDAKPPAPPVSTPVAPSVPVAKPAYTAPAVAPSPAQANTASDNELLAAFLRGAKTTNQMPTQLTPELMELLGSLLHTATHGTLQLLMSRQEFKRGVRSEVTMILTDTNNPLKFSPNAEIALAHMLGPKAKGFMDAEQAMSNAFADLRAHQFGVMVGMRAALANVLEQFTPDKLEGKLTEKSKLDSLFAASRKAKLWDLFCQLYANIANEAEDDFHVLFGKSFAKAYDEQMARFKSEK